MKIWCALCRKKVEVSNFTERVVPINHGSRKMVEGIDSKGHRVAQFVSMNPAVVAKSVKRKPKKRRGFEPFSLR
jgi:hypothetical protein